jgi:hypothetical protein
MKFGQRLGQCKVAEQKAIRFGATEVVATGDYTRTERRNGFASASARLPLAVLTAAGIDYLADVTILDLDGTPYFAGVVESARPEGDDVILQFRNGQELSDTRIAGLGHAGPFDAREVIWTIARTSGLGSGRIRISGWTPGPEELFEVVAPVHGVKAPCRLRVAGVLFTSHPGVPRLAGELGPAELIQVFQRAPCWAISTARAATTLDAEAAALPLIDLAIGWLEIRSHFAAASLPGGQFLTFSRENTRSGLRRAGAIYVRGLVTSRRWLRAPQTLRAEVELDLAGVDMLPIPDIAADRVTPQEQAAIAAWRAAAGPGDAIARAEAVSRTIEFLCADIRSFDYNLFPPSARKALLKLARAQFNPDQLKRFHELVGDLNKPSLGLKLDMWLEREGVSMTPGDREVLDKVRGVRNDFVHGRSSGPPDEADVRYATSLLGRCIVQRVHNIAMAALAGQ